MTLHVGNEFGDNFILSPIFYQILKHCLLLGFHWSPVDSIQLHWQVGKITFLCDGSASTLKALTITSLFLLLLF